MASDDLVQIRTDSPVVAAIGDLIYLVRAGIAKGGLAEEVGALGSASGIPIEYTKQRNFAMTQWTATTGVDFAINGAFTGDTGWTKGTGWVWNAGNYMQCDTSQTGDTDLVNTGNTVTAGVAYNVRWYMGFSVGEITPVVGGTVGTTITTTGTAYHSEVIVATNTDPITLRADLDFDGWVDDVTIKPANVTYPDLDDNQVSTVTISDGVHFVAPANMVDGGQYVLFAIQDGGGNATASWGTEFKWEGGVAPVLGDTNGAHDVIIFWSDGTSMYGAAYFDFY